ncbi:Copper amine oxidase N-terminal domain-containing protein [Paenibacillus sp. UNCCL117]|uniref:stalk domain-containing protein n=1 Tax=unclassified Paenibacillus TaxID=185978 RepID=UPI00087E2ADE|nr:MULTISPECIES: stalk domain-containing protein [unclassified Paenibacillus]SDC78081.1 Copper amine oxidase N-terminal domain-containing protein [Paenibacillus sp. cl123]SFW25976.1 Copper amine oxidase N-terminal domain-containing protein [Paenibacillus sp. UNCCL117]
MKVPRLLTMMLSLSLFGATGALASSMWGDFEGYAKVRLIVNEEEKEFGSNEVPGFLVKGSAVLPARILSEKLQSIVKWDNESKTVSVYKPNVHMVVAKTVGDDYSIQKPFGGVKKGDRLDFAVFAQVDGLKTPIYSFRIAIVSPSGEQVKAREEIVDGPKSSFWYTWPFNVTFSESGPYKVVFSIKPSSDSEYVAVSQKSILSD